MSFTARVLARLDEMEEAGTPARFLGLPRITLPAAVLAATTLVVAVTLLSQGGGGLPGTPRSPRSSRPASRAAIGGIGARAPLTQARSVAPAYALQTVPARLRSARRERAELEDIQAEHGRLQAELRRLQARPSTVYLGGDEDMDLVVHLDQVREMPPGQIQPAADHQQLD